MDPVQDRGSMDPVHESGLWTRSKVGVHGPLVHVLSSPKISFFQSYPQMAGQFVWSFTLARKKFRVSSFKFLKVQ